MYDFFRQKLETMIITQRIHEDHTKAVAIFFHLECSSSQKIMEMKESFAFSLSKLDADRTERDVFVFAIIVVHEHNGMSLYSQLLFVHEHNGIRHATCRCLRFTDRQSNVVYCLL
ncbi:unnamed protein product [Amoebophrya sp. A120]|nr:unnamed protein product [Amoebophrya sp. A120]|eukprot:GSA120T00004226001.1